MNYCEVMKQDADSTGITRDWYECGAVATIKHMGAWMCDRCYDVFNEPDNPPTEDYEKAKADAMGLPQQAANGDFE